LGCDSKNEAADLAYVLVFSFTWEANSDEAIYENNYKATKMSIANAVADAPSVDDILSQKDSTDHPFQGF
jgi:Uncharacterized conserved protein